MTIHYRAFPTSLDSSGTTPDGRRVLTGRVVPYDLVAEVMDEGPNGSPEFYREGFRRGAFGPQVNSEEKGVLGRIGLVHRHEGHGVQGLGYLGPFTALREEDDGLWGDVAILRTKTSDVEDLLNSGIDELSVEFRLPTRGDHTEVDPTGVRWRVKAHLDQVALEPKGAYRTAQVISMRKDMEEHEREEARIQSEEDELARDRRHRFEEMNRKHDQKMAELETKRAEEEHAREEREKAEKQRAEAQALIDEQEAADLRDRVQREAAETVARRRRLEELTKNDGKLAREQEDLYRKFGVQRPGPRMHR